MASALTRWRSRAVRRRLRRAADRIAEFDFERLRVQGEQIERIQLESRRSEFRLRRPDIERAKRGGT